jgi:hypothetical protein
MAPMLARFESSGFLPMGTTKTLVYATLVDNHQVLQHHSVDACHTICI